ncbi:MAG: Arc family DNA binding domain-containing protein [Bacillota bacterium]|nr:Arc family DNA binding domain-containing protein [Bacillota bacterium]
MAEKKTVLLRLNPKTWEELSQWAEDEFRSINGQIEYILHEAITKRRKAKPASFKEDGEEKDT